MENIDPPADTLSIVELANEVGIDYSSNEAAGDLQYPNEAPANHVNLDEALMNGDTPSEAHSDHNAAGSTSAEASHRLDLNPSMFNPSNSAMPDILNHDIREKLARVRKSMADKLKSKPVDKEPVTADGELPQPSNEPGSAFQDLRKMYMERKRAGTLTTKEEIEFMKIERAEQARVTKLQADEEYDRISSPDPHEVEDGLFVSREPSMFPSEAFEPPIDQGSKRGKRHREGRDGRGENDGENYQEQPKKCRGRKKHPAPNMTNVNSLMGTDVFADTAAAAKLPNQPAVVVAARREDALKALIASIPKERRALAEVDKAYLDRAIKDFTGTGSVKAAADGKWHVKGMKCTLMHYQILAVAFMRRRESNVDKPAGGIVADQMGLGKTIQMLTNIVNGRQRSPGKEKTTLIVATPALVKQWVGEIEARVQINPLNSKGKHGLSKVVEYHAGSKINAIGLEAFLKDCDIVLTTYSEVIKSWPKVKIPEELGTAKQREDWYKEEMKKRAGILHRIRWYRVVLDEAHAIKNHENQTSKACRALNAQFRWCMTGTVLLNNVTELYAYLNFLQVPNIGTFKLFHRNFCSEGDPDRAKKLSVLLNICMIRRTHSDTLFQSRLLDLPEPRETTVWLEFNEVERQIYEIVRTRFIQKINSMSKKETTDGKYKCIYTLLLRLRQLTGHVLLIRETLADLLERTDCERLQRLTEDEHQVSGKNAALLVHLRELLKTQQGPARSSLGLGGTALFKNRSIRLDVPKLQPEDADKAGGAHGILGVHFRKILDDLRKSKAWDVIAARTRCCICHQTPENPHITSCYHMYCLPCLQDLMHHAARVGRDQAKCAECNESFVDPQRCEEFGPIESTSNAASPANSDGSSRKGSGKSTSSVPDWTKMSGPVLPSAKTLGLKAQVSTWLEDGPTDKIIIFSQFIGLLNIVARVCQTEQWSYCEYTGQMSQDMRAKSLFTFGDPTKKIQILLASLKCGGIGLNLTMACRVIILDSWWNAAVEQQAFCRIFRIGQERETRLTRFVVKDTIDARMMDMKEDKQIKIDAVMDDYKIAKNFSIEELMGLFGPVGNGKDGQPFIFAKEPIEEDDFPVIDLDSE